jgi:TonB family protein
MALLRWLLVFVVAVPTYDQLSLPRGSGAMCPDGAYQVGNGVSQPTLMFSPSCEMPDLARKLRARGEVTLSFTVKADGSVRDVQIVKSAGYGIDERAAECMRRSRFKPGTKDGSPVDAAFRYTFQFSVSPQPRLWAAGPLTVAADIGVTLPVLKSGTIPAVKREPGDEVVLFQFTISPTGDVVDIQPIEGKESKSLTLLTKSLSSWKFRPASNVSGPVVVEGKVLFIKGEDQFRYQVSKAFLDFGSVRPVETERVASPSASTSIMKLNVDVVVDLDPTEASKQLIHNAPPQYPAEARAAHLQGTVSLLIRIGRDGSVTDVKEISGPPELVPPAIAAVRKWRYRPIMADGELQEARTVVDITFKLPD